MCETSVSAFRLNLPELAPAAFLTNAKSLREKVIRIIACCIGTSAPASIRSDTRWSNKKTNGAIRPEPKGAVGEEPEASNRRKQCASDGFRPTAYLTLASYCESLRKDASAIWAEFYLNGFQSACQRLSTNVLV